MFGKSAASFAGALIACLIVWYGLGRDDLISTIIAVAVGSILGQIVNIGGVRGVIGVLFGAQSKSEDRTMTKEEWKAKHREERIQRKKNAQ